MGPKARAHPHPVQSCNTLHSPEKLRPRAAGVRNGAVRAFARNFMSCRLVVEVEISRAQAQQASMTSAPLNGKSTKLGASGEAASCVITKTAKKAV